MRLEHLLFGDENPTGKPDGGSQETPADTEDTQVPRLGAVVNFYNKSKTNKTQAAREERETQSRSSVG